MEFSIVEKLSGPQESILGPSSVLVNSEQKCRSLLNSPHSYFPTLGQWLFGALACCYEQAIWQPAHRIQAAAWSSLCAT